MAIPSNPNLWPVSEQIYTSGGSPEQKEDVDVFIPLFSPRRNVSTVRLRRGIHYCSTQRNEVIDCLPFSHNLGFSFFDYF
jgi:hypothetical protein